MTEMPIVTQLPSEHLHGYAAAMAEVADACLRVSDVRDWALDRAALARGIILRDTAQAEAPLPDDDLATSMELMRELVMRSEEAPPDAPVPPPRDSDERPRGKRGIHLMPYTEAAQQAHKQMAASMAAAATIPAEPPREAIAGTDQAAPARQPSSAQQRSMRDMSEAEKEEMRQLYVARTPVREIAARFSVAFTSLYSMIAARGWKIEAEPTNPPRAPEPARPPAIDDDMEAARIDVVQHGRGAKWIAEEYGWELPFAQQFCADARAKAAA